MGNIYTSKAINFLDVETTNLNTDKSAILQIAIITDWDDGRREVWSTKIKPKEVELEFASPDALKICNYNKAEWSDAPYFSEVAEKIVQKLRWGPIVGHNVQFDIDHLNAVLKRYGWSICRDKVMAEPTANDKLYRFGYPLIDTCALSYLFLPVDCQYQNLDYVREYLNLEKTKSHDALYDAIDCSKVFYHILEQKYNSTSTDNTEVQ